MSCSNIDNRAPTLKSGWGFLLLKFVTYQNISWALLVKQQLQVSNRTIAASGNNETINPDSKQATPINIRPLFIGVMVRYDFCLQVKINDCLADFFFDNTANKHCQTSNQ